MQYPQPPMPRPTIGARLRNLSLLQKVLTGCGAALALLLVCFCALAALGAIQSFGKGSASSTTPTAVLVQGVTPTATFTPTATPTPAGPQIISDATFGGLKDAFQAKYGAPIFSNNGVLFQFKFTAADGSDAVVAIQLQNDETRDGKAHVITITVNPLDKSQQWNDATAEATAKQFLPKDAKFQKNKQVSGLGLYHLYLSTDLGVTFKADAFSDSTGKLVKPGTFWLTCGTTDAGGCTLQLGDV